MSRKEHYEICLHHREVQNVLFLMIQIAEKLYKLVMMIICFGVRALGMKQICSCTVYALESPFKVYEAMMLKVPLVGRCSFSVHEHQSLFFVSFFCFLFLFLFVFSSSSRRRRRRRRSSSSSTSIVVVKEVVVRKPSSQQHERLRAYGFIPIKAIGRRADLVA